MRWRALLIFVVFIIIVCQMVFCWNVDIASATLMNNHKLLLTNGFGCYDAMMVYHVSLYGLIMSFVVQMFLCLFIVMKEYVNETENKTEIFP